MSQKPCKRKRVAPEPDETVRPKEPSQPPKGGSVSSALGGGCGQRLAYGDGDTYRALSVSFLSSCFLEDLSVQLGEKVHEIEPRIRAAGADVVCPRSGDAKLVGAAYVDVAKDEHAGRATCMLSYTWQYEVHVIVDALIAYCKRSRLSPEAVRVWICALCVNQWRVKESLARGEQVPFDEFRETFYDKVTKIRTILALLSPWQEPLYLKRVWTIFEFYTGTSTDDVNIEIVFPERDEQAFLDKLRCDAGIVVLSDIFKTIGDIKVQNADASFMSDRKNVMRILLGSSIEEGKLDAFLQKQLPPEEMLSIDKACAPINEKVIQKMQQWFVHGALNRVQLELESCLTGFAHIGLLCNQLGMFSEGLGCLGTGIGVAEGFYKGEACVGNTLECDDLSESGVLAIAGLLKTKGKVFTYRGMEAQKAGDQQAFEDDYAEAFKHYERVMDLLKRRGLVCTTTYAEVMQDVSLWYGKKKQVEESICAGLESKRVFEAIQRTQNTMYGNLLKSLGISYHLRGQRSRRQTSDAGTAGAPMAAADEDYRLSWKMYERSEQVFIEIGQVKNPWYLDGQAWMGVHCKDQGQPEEGLRRIEHAKHQLELLGLQKSPQYEGALRHLSDLYAEVPRLRPEQGGSRIAL